jgi:DUF2955 family protein
MLIKTFFSPATQLSIAQVRILRLAFGTAISLWFSQLIGGDMSFVAAVFTMFILALPLPVPKPKAGIMFVLVFSGCLYAGLLLLPTLLNQPMVGMILLVMALFWSFYYTTKGGSAVVGTFVTVGIALTTAVGSVNVDAVVALVGSMSIAAFVGILFVYVAHAFLPDSMAEAPDVRPSKEAQKKEEPDLSTARWSAFRSLLIVLPVAIWFLFSAASTAYVPVMIKVASMGQQAANDATKTAGKSLILSTLIGGAGAIIGWQILSIAPTLPVYVIFVALAGLFCGVRIFQGPAMHPQAATWSYAYLTMLVILAPAVMDGSGGDAAGVKFWDRLLMFGGTTLYAVIAVYVVDAFRPRADLT